MFGRAALRIARDLVKPKTPMSRDYARLDIIRFISRFLLPRYRFEWPAFDWWQDPEFNAYLARFNELNGATALNSRRRWMTYQIMRLAVPVPGDTAECGVFAGATSYLICRVFPDRTHFIFDSFEGLSKPVGEDGTEWKQGNLAISLEKAKANLPFSNISWHKGWIPDRFPDVEGRTFAFVHIDVDLYQPTLDSFKFFYPRMSKGGVIVCDDYGCSGCPGATTAANEFLKDKPEKMISAPCGGGFIIKGTAAAVFNRLDQT
jgi:O-methyltransferase